MAQEIFDQDRPRDKPLCAERPDEAFAGCEHWTIALAFSATQRGRFQSAAV